MVPIDSTPGGGKVNPLFARLELHESSLLLAQVILYTHEDTLLAFPDSYGQLCKRGAEADFNVRRISVRKSYMYIDFKLIHALGGRYEFVINRTDIMINRLRCSSTNMNYLLIVNCCSRDFQ